MILRVYRTLITSLLLLSSLLVSNFSVADTARVNNPVGHTANYDGMTVNYSDFGPKEAQALVFIHGWSCDSSFWREQMPFFAESYRVIAIDLPGFGQSDKKQDVDYSMDFFAHAVKAVIDQANVKEPVIIGHSMGYAVIQQYLLLYPNTAKAVGIVDGAYYRLPEDLAMLENESVNYINLMKGPERLKATQNFIDMTFYGKTSPELRAQISSVMISADPHAAISSMEEMHKVELWQRHRFDVPAFAVYANIDGYPQDNQTYLKSVFPKLTYHEWDDTGHYLMLEKPERFNSILKQFLEGL